MSGEYLRFEAISRRFPGVQALDGVSFGVGEGRVHALLGENGAGKSTLLRILGGALRPDAGLLRLAGQAQAFHSSLEGINAGVAVIHQELQLVPQLSVSENVFLGRLPVRRGFLDRAALARAARSQLESLGAAVDPEASVGSLPIAARQLVEIAKALARDARVIAFDEPTSSLSSREVDALFRVIRSLAARGRVVLYVSHRMEEVRAICDEASVLRDGRLVETFPDLTGVETSTLVKRMVGRAIFDMYDHRPRETGTSTALQVEDIVGAGLAAPVSLRVGRGEIVALFGLMGAGRTELLRLVYGAAPRRSGRVEVGGRVLRAGSPREALRAGLVMCPEDRRREGLVPGASVRENLCLGPVRPFWIDTGAEQRKAAAAGERLGIRVASLDQAVRSLSGGNQQKVVIGRGLGAAPQVLLLDEPTRGIDVGARGEIYALLQELAGSGVALLLATSELPEALGIADRILVMREGRLVAEEQRAAASEASVLEAALPVDALGLAG
jgi:L-arabinose transport system ATP-binding protein